MDEIRSLLFVPGDSEKKIAKARDLPADAIVFDLEDAVLPERRAAARELVTAELKSPGVPGRVRIVRINAIDTADAAKDLDRIVECRPDVVMLPKIRSVDDVDRLTAQLEKREARHGAPSGSIEIVAVATETPQIMFSLAGLQHAGERLVGLTWGAEDLATALGAHANKDGQGDWLFTYQLARAQCLLAARACGAQAIDTVHADFRDSEGLEKSCAAARRDGFTGKLAIHPNQVGPINDAFTPTAKEADSARRVIAAFDAEPGVGVVQLDGRMLDIPHLTQAKNTLARFERFAGR